MTREQLLATESLRFCLEAMHEVAHDETAAVRYAIEPKCLGEIVTERYLPKTEKKADQLWERAEKALKNTDANPVWLAKVLADRNVEGLAEIVNELF